MAMETKKNILDHIQPREIKVPSDEFFLELASGIKKDKERKLRMSKIVYLSMAAAAVLLVTLVVIYTGNSDLRSSSQQISFAELDEQEIREYISDQKAETETTDPVKINVTDTTKKVHTTTQAENLEKAFSELSDEEILQFFKEAGHDPLETEEEEELITIF
jgi:predicted house-cleaning NTP pyrophosphatase (Maf/HAM1 superfamily)